MGSTPKGTFSFNHERNNESLTLVEQKEVWNDNLDLSYVTKQKEPAS